MPLLFFRFENYKIDKLVFYYKKSLNFFKISIFLKFVWNKLHLIFDAEHDAAIIFNWKFLENWKSRNFNMIIL